MDPFTRTNAYTCPHSNTHTHIHNVGAYRMNAPESPIVDRAYGYIRKSRPCAIVCRTYIIHSRLVRCRCTFV